MLPSRGDRLQGAAFSGGMLQQQSPNDPEVAGVPDVTFAYVPKDKPNPYQVSWQETVVFSVHIFENHEASKST